MLGELDFRKELECLQQFRAFVQQNGLSAIASAPAPYPAFCGRRVLTMERIDGASMVDLDTIRQVGLQDPEQILINALNVWSLSVVAAPFFHADLHAGNLLVQRDGRVVFLDFGIVGRIPEKVFAGLGEMGAAIGVADYRAVAQAMVKIGAADDDVDIDKFAADLQKVIDKMNTMTVQVDADGNVDQSDVAVLAVDLVQVADSNGVRLPREFGVLMKQVLYFDRYTQLLAPGLDLINDDRVQLQNPGGGVFRS